MNWDWRAVKELFFILFCFVFFNFVLLCFQVTQKQMCNVFYLYKPLSVLRAGGTLNYNIQQMGSHESTVSVKVKPIPIMENHFLNVCFSALVSRT